MNDSDSIIQLFDPLSSTFTYILVDKASGEAAMIDAVDSHIERDMAAIKNRGLKLKWVIETHAHADHITGAAIIAQRMGAPTAAPALCGVVCGIVPANMQLNDGDKLSLGAEFIRAIHTPGHTAGSMCFQWRDAVLTGDTLLIGGCGRTDFQSGSAAALYDSITQKLFMLQAETRVLPAHDYQGRTESTIGVEKRTNPRFVGKKKQEFIDMMNALNLAPPEMIDTAVAANQRLDSLTFTAIRIADGYAGDMPLALAHAWWSRGDAVMVDVRTQAEFDWVGRVPNTVCISWKIYPGMAVNPDFDRELLANVLPQKPVLFLCRSGVRSIDGARRAQSLGYSAYNVLEGFEGDCDAHQHRASTNGWQHAGYPWIQG